MLDRELLAKILSRTTSDSDAEALVALKKANAIVKRDAGTWYDVLGVGSSHSRPAVTVPPPRRAVRPPFAPGSIEGEVADFMKDAFSEAMYNFGRGVNGRSQGRKR